MSTTSATTTSQAGAVNRPTRQPGPLAHLTRGGGDKAGSDDAGPTSFEAALRSASGRAAPNIDTGGGSLPLFRAAPTRTEAAAPNRPAPRAEKPGTDRSTRQTGPTTPETRRDDRTGDAATRSDDRVATDRHATDRSAENGDTTTGKVDDDGADATSTDDTATAEGGEATAETDQADGSTEEATDTVVAPEVAVQLIAPELAAELMATVTTVDPEIEVDTAATDTTVTATTEIDNGAQATTGTEQGNVASDSTIDSGPVIVVDAGPSRGEGEAEGEQSGAAADQGRREGPSLQLDDGSDTATSSVPGQGTQAADHGRQQQLVVTGDAAATTRTATTDSSGNGNGTALTGLDRVGGPTRTAGRGEASAAADAAPADAPADADGPDAVWRQVRRALGNLRTRADGEREMVVRLHPEQLGSVTVRVNTSDAGVRVSLVADTAAAAVQLGQQRHQLLGELGESGLGGATVDIGQHGFGDQRGAGDGNGRDDRGRSALAGAAAAAGFRSGERASAGTRRRSSSGSLDVEL